MSVYRLEKARAEHVETVGALYKSLIGQEGCTWNEYYPEPDSARNDYARGCLYVYTEDGAVMGAVSVLYENEFDDLDLWRVNDGAHNEISRVCISKPKQGRGNCKRMLALLLAELANNGCKSVRLLVYKHNYAAKRVYEALGFEFLGEHFAFGHEYYACEKRL